MGKKKTFLSLFNKLVTSVRESKGCWLYEFVNKVSRNNIDTQIKSSKENVVKRKKKKKAEPTPTKFSSK